jgi:hypothetical protein
MRTRTANRAYRATLYGAGQTPAASAATGAPNTRVPSLGARSHGRHHVDLRVLVADGESFRPGNAGTLTAFF